MSVPVNLRELAGSIQVPKPEMTLKIPKWFTNPRRRRAMREDGIVTQKQQLLLKFKKKGHKDRHASPNSTPLQKDADKTSQKLIQKLQEFIDKDNEEGSELSD